MKDGSDDDHGGLGKPFSLAHFFNAQGNTVQCKALDLADVALLMCPGPGR